MAGPEFDQQDISNTNGPVDTRDNSGTTELHVHDKDAISVLQQISSGVGGTSGTIFKHNEVDVNTKVATYLTDTELTVTAGKIFTLKTFVGSYDAQALMYIWIEKQTDGAGPWDKLFRLVMMSGGQGNATLSYPLGNGIQIADGGDKIRITYDASIAKGTISASYSGDEI